MKIFFWGAQRFWGYGGVEVNVLYYIPSTDFYEGNIFITTNLGLPPLALQ